MFAGGASTSRRGRTKTALVLNSKTVSGKSRKSSSRRRALGADVLEGQGIAQLAAADAHVAVGGEEAAQLGLQVGPVRVEHALVLVVEVGLQDAIAAVEGAAALQVEVEVAAGDGAGGTGAVLDERAFLDGLFQHAAGGATPSVSWPR